MVTMAVYNFALQIKAWFLYDRNLRHEIDKGDISLKWIKTFCTKNEVFR